ncbi:nucleotidyltransferase [Elizabethkingia anophelis]|nr:nucleotidyltransferase [Elizabethkingia anophelis]MDV3682218.1 nucleotidyltransferase [Elizabethkingia anophelis]MDV3701874.1 nucleotidyltransferase [Elizabethkingia anophelis]MDV3761180.1 nucleotidyltransferase [Elizabethkingia anophelis]MDV3800376.1 nucleotidyltransferase [Elizabethkingia anophelis]
MRTITEIYNTLLAEKERQAELSGLTSNSKAAVWRLMFYIVAFAIYTHEQIFGAHQAELEVLLRKEKAHGLLWYREKAKAFQYGFQLLPDKDQFDNTGKTDDEIEASKIIKYAAISEDDKESRLILKIATETNGKLSPITESQYNGFRTYANEYRDAGVKLTIVNYLPDILKMHLQIKVDDKIIDENGFHHLQGNKPFEDAINEFMKELPFNGELMLNSLVDKLQKVPGVIDPWLFTADSKWLDPKTGGYGNYEPIFISKIPESGYFDVDWPNTLIEYKSVKNVV